MDTETILHIDVHKNNHTLSDKISLRYCLPSLRLLFHRCCTEAFLNIHWETHAMVSNLFYYLEQCHWTTASYYWSWTYTRLLFTPGQLSFFTTCMKYRTGMTNNVHGICAYTMQWRTDILRATYCTRKLMYTCSRL